MLNDTLTNFVVDPSGRSYVRRYFGICAALVGLSIIAIPSRADTQLKLVSLVPEPSSGTLMILPIGLVGLICLWRRPRSEKNLS